MSCFDHALLSRLVWKQKFKSFHRVEQVGWTFFLGNFFELWDFWDACCLLMEEEAFFPYALHSQSEYKIAFKAHEKAFSVKSKAFKAVAFWILTEVWKLLPVKLTSKSSGNALCQEQSLKKVWVWKTRASRKARITCGRKKLAKKARVNLSYICMNWNGIGIAMRITEY